MTLPSCQKLITSVQDAKLTLLSVLLSMHITSFALDNRIYQECGISSRTVGVFRRALRYNSTTFAAPEPCGDIGAAPRLKRGISGRRTRSRRSRTSKREA